MLTVDYSRWHQTSISFCFSLE